MTRSAVSRADLLCALQLSAECKALVLPTVEQIALVYERQEQHEAGSESRGKGGTRDHGQRAQVRQKIPLRMPTGWHGELVLHSDAAQDFEDDAAPRVVPELERPSPEEAKAIQRAVDRPQAQHLVRAQLRASVCQTLPWQGEVHWAQAVRQVAQGELLHILPRRQAPRWPAHLHVLVDSASPSVATFKHEIEAMLASLKRAMGSTGLIEHRVSASLAELQGPKAIGRGCTGQKWLVLGDARIGEYEFRSDTSRLFAAWVKRMRLAQNEVFLIGPLSHSALLAAPTGVIGRSWSNSRPVVGRANWHSPLQLDTGGIRTVLALLVAFGQVSAPMLRALCQLVEAPHQAYATEWAVWNSALIERRGSFLGPKDLWKHEDALALVTKLPLSLLMAARRLQRLYQYALPAHDLHLTTLRLAHCDPRMAVELADEVQAAEAFLRQIAAEKDAGTAQEVLLEASKAARLVAKAPASLRAAEARLFRRVATRAYRANLLRGDVIDYYAELGTLISEIAPSGAEDDKRIWMMQMDARGISLVEDTRNPSQARAIDIPIGYVSSARGVTLHEGGQSQWMAPLHEGMVCHALDSSAKEFELDFGQQSVHMLRVKRPHWAAEFAQRFDGLEAMIHLPDGHDFWVDPQLRDEVLVDLPHPMRLQIDGHGPRLAVGVVSQATDTLNIIAVFFRYLPPATFLMGSPEGVGDGDEHPQHRVTLTQALWLAETPCTQALWQTVMGHNPSHFNKGPDAPQRPVENVSWDDVQQFLAKLNALLPEGCEAVLPTEAQWEYACRAGTTTAYWWGDEPDDSKANVDGQGNKDWDTEEGTTPVDRYPPNPWGLRDMHGNVWEWCADGEQRIYEQSTARDPMGDTGGDARVVRGGSWFYHPGYARSASRHWRHLGYRNRFQGFRFALRSSSPQGAEPQPGGLKAGDKSQKVGAAGGRSAGAGASAPATRATMKMKGPA